MHCKQVCQIVTSPTLSGKERNTCKRNTRTFSPFLEVDVDDGFFVVIMEELASVVTARADKINVRTKAIFMVVLLVDERMN